MRLRVIVTVLVLILLPLTVFVLLQRTGLINRAAAPEEEGGIATIALDPQSSSVEVGEEFDVAIKLNTQGIGMSIAQVHLTYTYEGEEPPFEVVDALGTKADLIQIQPGTIPELNFVTNDVTDNPAPGTTQHQVIIRLDGVIADDSLPYISNGDVLFGTITFRANRATKESVLRFDPDLSKITTFDTGQDVLLIPTNASITVTGEGGTSAPQIVSVYPLRARVGNTVIIEGGNFGEEQGTSTVAVTGTEVTEIRNWSDTSITFLVPEGAVSGKVSVTTDGGTTLSSEAIKIETDTETATETEETAPRVESFFPDAGISSTSITVIGTNFGTEQGTSTVRVGDQVVTDIVTWSNVLIEMRLPTTAVTDQITIQTDSGTSTTPTCFTVTGTTSTNDACTTQAFSLTGVLASVTDTTAEIRWTTDTASSSQVLYGLSDIYTKQTDEDDTDPRVTAHIMTLADLIPCTTYHFDIRSIDADAGVATSGDQAITTTGCVGEATVVASSTKTVAATEGGTVALSEETGGVTVDAPTNYTTGKTTIQIKKLQAAQTTSAISTPPDTTVVGGNVYELEALDEQEESVTSFIEPLTITMTYTPEDVITIDEDTLAIHRWNGTAWEALTGCAVNRLSYTVTCTTTQFSTFGLFGEEITLASGTETETPPTTTPPPVTTTPAQPEVTPSGTPESTPSPTPIPVTGIEEYTQILTVIGVAFIIMGALFPALMHIATRSAQRTKKDHY